MATIETPELDQQLAGRPRPTSKAPRPTSTSPTPPPTAIRICSSPTPSPSRRPTSPSATPPPNRPPSKPPRPTSAASQQLQSFEKVYAPFDGIVTARNTDIGALINAGSATSTTAKELFHIAAIDKLRVFVAVPEVYAPTSTTATPPPSPSTSIPASIFNGTIARNSNAIDPASRTLNVEVDVDNPNGKLLPGAYVFVHFKLPRAQPRQLSIPSNTLLFRAEGLQVGVVRDGHVHLQPITIGHDNGATVEIASGLTANDQVILDPSDSLAEGQPVHVADSHPGGDANEG